MNTYSKIALIGGTGKSGKYVLRHLLDLGFPLRLLLRNPGNFLPESPQIEIVKGDARQYKSVETLLSGCGAVISTLGQPHGEPPIFSQASQNVLKAMQLHGIDRYILTTGLQVDTPKDQKGEYTQGATDWMKDNYPNTTADKQLEYDILAKSPVNWTLVRLPMILQTEEKKTIQTSLQDCPGTSISATDLAHFLGECLLKNSFSRQAPFLASI